MADNRIISATICTQESIFCFTEQIWLQKMKKMKCIERRFFYTVSAQKTAFSIQNAIRIIKFRMQIRTVPKSHHIYIPDRFDTGFHHIRPLRAAVVDTVPIGDRKIPLCNMKFRRFKFLFFQHLFKNIQLIFCKITVQRPFSKIYAVLLKQ